MSADSMLGTGGRWASTRRPLTSVNIRSGLFPVWSVVVTLTLLEGAIRAGLIAPSAVPPPSTVGPEVVRRLLSMDTWSLVLATAQGWFVGLGAAALVGATVGVVIGSFRLLDRLLSGVLELVRPVPSVALIPLCVIVLGVGMETKYVLVFIGSLWPIVNHTSLGVRGVDVVATDVCRAYGLTAVGRLRHIVLPTAAAEFLTGLRVSAAIALIVAITVELIVGVPGLGQSVNLAQQNGDSVGMWSGIVIIGALGTVLNAGFLWLERRVLHWHASQRMEAM